MKKLCILSLLCICFLLSACGGSGSPSLEQSLPQDAQLHVPLKKDIPKFYISVHNNSTMQGDMKGTLMALLQSEYGAREVNSANKADYIIYIDIIRFGKAGTEFESASTADMAFPGMAGAGIGAHIGGSFDGYGTLIGAGVGFVAGIALGALTGGGEVLIWNAEMKVKIIDTTGKQYTSTLTPEVRGDTMDMHHASMSLENSVAWYLVRGFKKVEE